MDHENAVVMAKRFVRSELSALCELYGISPLEAVEQLHFRLESNWYGSVAAEAKEVAKHELAIVCGASRRRGSIAKRYAQMQLPEMLSIMFL